MHNHICNLDIEIQIMCRFRGSDYVVDYNSKCYSNMIINCVMYALIQNDYCLIFLIENLHRWQP